MKKKKSLEGVLYIQYMENPLKEYVGYILCYSIW